MAGRVYHLDDNGNCSEKFTVGGPIKALFYYEKRDVLISITETLVLTQHQIDMDSETTELVKVLHIRQY